MKVLLLYRDRDFEPKAPPLRQADALIKDLELATLFDGMARGDDFVFEASKKVVLSGSETDIDAIRYRQGVLADCLKRPRIARELYALAIEAVELEKKHFFSSLLRSPDWVLRRAVDHMEGYLSVLRKLARLADRHAGSFASEG